MSANASPGPSSVHTARAYFWEVSPPLYAELLSQPDLARAADELGSGARNWAAEETREVIEGQELQIEALTQKVAVLEGHLNAYEMNPKNEGIRRLLEEQARSEYAQEVQMLKKEQAALMKRWAKEHVAAIEFQQTQNRDLVGQIELLTKQLEKVNDICAEQTEGGGKSPDSSEKNYNVHRYKELIADLREQLQNKQQQMDDIAQQNSDLQGKIGKYNVVVDKLESDLAEAQASVAGLEAKIVQNQQTITDLE